jgi:hypothetical protein
MTRRDLRKPLYVEPAKRPKPTGQPDTGESLIQEKLTPLVEALVHSDESCRRAAVGHVLRTCIPAVIGRLIGRLADHLDGAGTTQRQTLASQAQLEGGLIKHYSCRSTEAFGPAAKAGASHPCAVATSHLRLTSRPIRLKSAPLSLAEVNYE